MWYGIVTYISPQSACTNAAPQTDCLSANCGRNKVSTPASTSFVMFFSVIVTYRLVAELFGGYHDIGSMRHLIRIH